MTRRSTLGGFLRETGGTAAVEMAIWIGVIVVPLLSVVDIGLYSYRKMQVAIAAQQAAEAVRRACGFAAVPVTDTSQCASGTLSGAITAGMTGTQLGTNVTLVTGYPIEGYYCVNASNVLTAVGTLGTTGSPPTGTANCSGVIAGSTTLPADYIRIRVSYTYAPTFSVISAGSLLTTPIVREAWLRLG